MGLDVGQGLILPPVPQALVKHEQMEMLHRPRQLVLSTDSFNFAAYHTLDEVRKHKIWGILRVKNPTSWGFSLLHVQQGGSWL